MSAWTEIDGVPVLHAARAGATTVNVMFRVGQADERLPQRGVTHLIEHLALFPIGLREHHSNGQTGTHLTNFHATGTPSEVVSFMSTLCASLQDLPMQRMAVEKSLLRTEASQRSGWVYADLAIWQYGARGDGAVAYEEFGLDQLTADDLRQWSSHFFTADNCVAVVYGPEIPDDLRLALPRGERRPIDPADRITPRRRSTFSSGRGFVAFEALVPRTTENTLAAQIINREMTQDLRYDSAFSYTAGCSYEARDAEHATIRGFADALEETMSAVVGSTVDLMARLRHGRFPDALVEEAITARINSLEDPDYLLNLAGSEALNRLVGGDAVDPQILRREWEAVSAGAVRQAVTAIMNDVVLQVPYGHSADWGGFEPLPLFSTQKVAATSIHRLHSEEGAFFCSDAGVSLVRSGQPVTVFFSAAEGYLTWPDGLRVLIGSDGLRLAVEPNLTEGGRELVAFLDRQIRPGLTLPQRPRDLDDIPVVPPSAAPPVGKAEGWLRRRRKS